MVLGLVGVGVLIWLFNAAQENSSSPSRGRSYTQPTPTPSYTPPAVSPPQQRRLDFSEPPVGQNNVLSVAQIRWCLREDIRIEVLRPMPTTNSQIDQFNSVVSNNNNRCGSYRYRQGALARARREVEQQRPQIVANVSPPWQRRSVTSSGSAVQSVVPDPVAPRQPTPVQPRAAQPSPLTLDIQNSLKALGYDLGPADGLYGGRTKSAIQSFQRDVELTPDGRVSQELLQRLQQESSARRTQSTKAAVPSESASTARVSPDRAERSAIENTCGWRRSSNGPADYRRCVESEEAQLRAFGRRPDTTGRSASDRSSIENTCGWRKNSNGPDDYYKCVSQSLLGLNNVRARPDLSNLSSMERSAIENTCGWRKNSNGPADYYQCIQAQITQLAGVSSRSDLLALSGAERSAIENTCGWRKNSNGPADYYQCVESQRRELSTIVRRPNLSQVSSVDRRGIESTCGWRRNSNGPADYYRCVEEQIRSLR